MTCLLAQLDHKQLVEVKIVSQNTSTACRSLAGFGMTTVPLVLERPTRGGGSRMKCANPLSMEHHTTTQGNPLQSNPVTDLPPRQSASGLLIWDLFRYMD